MASAEAAQAKEAEAGGGRESLWRSGVHTLGTSLLSMPLGFAASIIVARALGPAGKGGYDLIFATATLLSIILGMSLQPGITYVVARGEAQLRSLAWRLTGVVLAVTLAGAAGLILLRHTSLSSALLPAHSGRWVIGAIALTLIATELAGYWRAMLIGREEIITANHRDLTSRAVHVLLLGGVVGGAFLLEERVTLSWLVWVTVVATVLKVPIFLGGLRGKLAAGSGDSGLGRVLRFAIPCYLGNLVQFLNYRLDIFVVSFYAGLEAVGLYSLAVTLGQLLWLIASAGATVLLPRVATSHAAGENIAARTAQAARFALWLSMVAGVVLLVVAERTIIILFGVQFRGSVQPLVLLMPGIVAFSTVSVLASYVAGIGKPRLNLYVALAGLVVTVVLDLTLIPPFGIAGAAMASTASYLTSAVLAIRFFTREAGLGIGARHVLLITGSDLSLAVTSLRNAARRSRGKMGRSSR